MKNIFLVFQISGNINNLKNLMLAFGSTNGYGSIKRNGDIKPETEAIYKQYAGLLLAPTEVTGGFKISPGRFCYCKLVKMKKYMLLSARTFNMKDRLNKGTWETLLFSGSFFFYYWF